MYRRRKFAARARIQRYRDVITTFADDLGRWHPDPTYPSLRPLIRAKPPRHGNDAVHNIVKAEPGRIDLYRTLCGP